MQTHREKILEGVEKARESGKRFGRPRVADAGDVEYALDLRAAGHSYKRIAREMGLSVGTVHSLVNKGRV